MRSAILETLAAMAVAAPLALLGAAPAVAASTAPSHRAEACALGAQVMAEQAKGGVNAFDDQDSFASEFIKRGVRDARPYGWGLSAWQKALLTKQPPVNLFVRCPELARRLPAGARMATAEDRAAVERLGPAPRIYIGRVAAPSISADGKTALVMEFSRCPGLCGGGSLYVYKRVNGRWVKDAPVFTMIS
ncbi:hypothetical protein [Caulobacter sp. 1776]|uniref:hypothetical protein n=1 Tax=Caulobacter sp. 1776 TaxID=3156420 RepID=UPI00339B743D